MTINKPMPSSASPAQQGAVGSVDGRQRTSVDLRPPERESHAESVPTLRELREQVRNAQKKKDAATAALAEARRAYRASPSFSAAEVVDKAEGALRFATLERERIERKFHRGQYRLPAHGRSGADGDELRAARARARTRVTVAPGAFVEVRGVRLGGDAAVPDDGLDPIEIEDLRKLNVLIVLREHELDARVMLPEHTHIVVAPFTGSRRGLLTSGQSLGPADIDAGEAGLKNLMARGIIRPLTDDDRSNPPPVAA
jgi:hypothetical protein